MRSSRSLQPWVIISNVTATKGVAFGPIIGDWSIITDGGFIVFPLTYVIGDVLSEVYGSKAARRAIFLGFCDECAGPHLAFWVTIYLPAADLYINQEHFENIVHAYTQLIVAGLAGFIVGQTINAWVVVKPSKSAPRRSTCGPAWSDPPSPASSVTPWSSAASPPSAIGISTVGDFVAYTALGWLYKTAIEVIMLPITYRVIATIKRREPTYQAAV